MANQIQLVMYEGYLGADPEMRYTPDGKAVVNFRIASSRSFKTANGEKVEETTWIKVAAWRKLAEVISQYCKKGSHVIVQGVLHPGKNGAPVVYQTKSGEWGASYEVTAEKVRIFRSNGDTVDEPSEKEEDEYGF